MSIRLIAADMDGTLLDSEKRLPPDFIPWVRQHRDIRTVIASGRQYWALLRDLESIRDDIIFIAENGGLVFEKGEMIYKSEMSREDTDLYLAVAAGIPACLPALCGAQSAHFYPTENPAALREFARYYDHQEFTEDLPECPKRDTIVKMTFFFEGHDAEDYYPLFKDKSESAAAVLSGPDWIDVANRETSKGAALEAIQQRYGISKDECMAFGDYLNDMPLLNACTESYCMANGHPDLKAVAKYIAESNDDDGVMKILRTLPA